VATKGLAALVGKPVVDPMGIEIGYVQGVDDRFLHLHEGGLILGRRFVDRVIDKVVVRGRWQDLLSGMNVVDNAGEFVGIVKDTVDEDYALRSLVLEDEEGEQITVPRDSLHAIDDWIELQVSQGDLYEG